MSIPCPDCADRPGEIHRGDDVYSLCPTCDGEGTLEPAEEPSEASKASPALNGLEEMETRLESLTERVEALEAGDFGR